MTAPSAPVASAGASAPPVATEYVHRHGFPWALMIALAMIVALELLLRVTHWPRRIPYELGVDEYFTAVAAIDRDGPAEVSIIGSSRTRESVHVPELRKTLEKELRRPVRVANYASSGARTIDFLAVARKLLRAPRPPRMIVVGISERDLSRDPALYDQVPLFWDFSDIRREWSQQRLLAINELPTVIRSELGRNITLLRYRTQLRLRIWHFLTGVNEYNSPATGDLTPWQRESPGHTLRRYPQSPASVRQYVARMNFSRYPDARLRESLDELARECRAAGVQLIFYEMPIPEVLRNALPRQVYGRFLGAVNRVAVEHGAMFVRLRVLKLRLSDNDFRESSHMASSGAKQLSRALAHRVIAPLLSGKLSAGLSSAPATRPARP